MSGLDVEGDTPMPPDQMSIEDLISEVVAQSRLRLAAGSAKCFGSGIVTYRASSAIDVTLSYSCPGCVCCHPSEG
jgi:hypothetical protein